MEPKSIAASLLWTLIAAGSSLRNYCCWYANEHQKRQLDTWSAKMLRAASSYAIMGYVQGDYTLEQAQNAVGPGWKNLVTILWLLCKQQDPPVMVEQVKEKFGGLRFYVGGAPDFIHDLTWKFESLSEKICETCGKPGEIRPGGWVKTLCDECNNKK